VADLMALAMNDTHLLPHLDSSFLPQHLGLLKCKLAKLRSQLIEAATETKGPKGEGFDVMKSGDARVTAPLLSPDPRSQRRETGKLVQHAPQQLADCLLRTPHRRPSHLPQVALIGFPSVGKSTLLSTITKTKSEVTLILCVARTAGPPHPDPHCVLSHVRRRHTNSPR
jgi:hypothetical protein